MTWLAATYGDLQMEQLVIGGGCFWCTEAMFNELEGVHLVVSGYAGGTTANPSYKEVCSGQTGHAEVIRIEFDPAVVSREDLLNLHLASHDPTSLNRQGGDVGPQYRSVVFYATENERALAEQVIRQVDEAGIFPDPIVTTLEPLTEFFQAEEEHQSYLAKFESSGPLQRLGMNAGYCSAVVAPKVAKFRKMFRDRLKATSTR